MGHKEMVGRILKPIRGLGKAWRRLCPSGSQLTTGLVLACACWPALANPTGPTVRHGQVQYTPGVDAQIQQLTDKAIVDWQSFSIGAGQSLRFLQPGQLSVILNRVVGGDPSTILGQLSANGNVFLINRAGIVFGPGSMVNVGGLVASTLDISDQDFLAGRYTFTQDPTSQLSAVINQGTITVDKGGYAVLMAPTVVNDGTIVAVAGKVVLAAGESTTLNFDGRNLVHYAVGSQVSAGPVLLAPGLSSDILADALGVDPALRADRLVRLPDGSVRLESSSGLLVQGGTVKADGDTTSGGGLVALESTSRTVLAPGSETTASGVPHLSDGGQVLVLSGMDKSGQGATEVQAGAVLAATGKDAGFIEVSGDTVSLQGHLELEGVGGAGGHFLLDPTHVFIIDGTQSPTPDVNGNTVIGDEWFRTVSGSMLTVESTGDILFDLSIDGVGASNDNTVNFRPLSGGDRGVTLRAGTDPIDGGAIDFGHNNTLYTGVSDLILDADGNIDFGDGRFAVSNSLSVTAMGDVGFGSSDIDIISGGFAPLTVSAGGAIDLDSSDINVAFQSFGNTDAEVSLTSNGGSINLGDADIRAVNEFTGAAGVNLTMLAAQAIVADSADGNPSTFVNLWNLDGDISLTATTGDILLADLDLSNQNGAGVYTLLFDAAGDLLVGGAIDHFGPATLEGGLSADLDNLSIDLKDGGNLAVNSDGSISLRNSQINPTAAGDTGGVSLVSSNGYVDLSGTSLRTSGSSVTPLSITAAQNIELDGATLDVALQSFGNTDAEVSLTSNTGSINLGDADIRAVNEFTGAAGVNLTMLAAQDIVADSADGNPSTFVNLWNLDGDISLTATTGDILLADLDLSNQNGAGVYTLLFDAAADLLVGGAIDHFGPATLEGGLSADLDNLSIDLKDGGNLTIGSGGDISMRDSRINPTASSDTGGVEILSGGAVDLAGTTIRTSGGSFTPLSITAEGDIDLDGGGLDLAFQSFGNTDAEVSLTSNTGSINLGDAEIRAVNEFTGAAGVNLTLEADDSIITSGDLTVLSLDGDISLTAATGDILLADLSLSNQDGSGTYNLNISAAGELVVGGELYHFGNATLEGVLSVDLDELLIEVKNGGNLAVNSDGSISLRNSQINPTAAGDTGGVSLVSSNGQVDLSGTSLRTSGSSLTPLSITAAQNIELDGATLNVALQSFGNTDAEVSLTSNGGSINLGDADIRAVNEFTGAAGVNLTMLAAQDIVADSADGNPSTFVNLWNLDGDISLTATTGDILLADLDLSNQNGAGVYTLLFDAAADLLVGGAIDHFGPATLESGLSADLDNLSIDLKDGGNLTIRSDGDISMRDSRINPTASSDTGGVEILSGGAVDLAGTTIRTSGGSFTPLSITAEGDIDLDGGGLDLAFQSFGNTYAEVSLTSNGGSINLGDADIRAVNEFTGAAGVNLTLEADDSITTAAPDGSPGTFTNVFALDGRVSLTSLTGDIILQDVGFTNQAGTSNDDFILNVGDSLTLGGEFRFNDSFVVNVPGSVTMDNLLLDINNNGDVSVTAGDFLSMRNSQINPTAAGDTGGVSLVSSNGYVDLSGTSLRTSGSSLTPLSITAAQNIELDGATLDVALQSFGNTDAEVSLTSNGGSINLGDADIRAVNEFTGAAGVNLTMLAAQDIVADSADGNPSTFVNLWNLDGDISLTATTGDILLADLDLSNQNGAGVYTLLFDAAADLLVGGAIDHFGPATLEGGLSADLDNLSIDLKDGGNLTIGSDGDISMRDSRINPTASSDTGGVEILSGGAVDLAGTTIRTSGGSFTPLSITAEGDIDLDGGGLDLAFQSFGNTYAEVSLTSNGGSINLGDADIRAVNEFTGAAGVNLTLEANDSITTAAPDGSPGTFTNVFALDGRVSLTSLTGDIILQDVGFTNQAGTSNDDFILNVGDSLTLGGEFRFNDSFVVNVPGSVTMDNLLLDINNNGDVSVTAGDFLSMRNSQINPTAAGDTGGVSLVSSNGYVDLSGTSLRTSGSSLTPLSITAAQNIELDGATLDVALQSFGNTDAEVSLTSNGGSINLGDADIRAVNEFTGAAGVNLSLSAEVDITASNDGNPGTYANTLQLDGLVSVTSALGDILLPDVNFENLSGDDLDLQVQTGDALVGGYFTFNDTFEVNVPGSVTFEDLILDVKNGGDILVTAGDSVAIVDSSLNPTANGDTGSVRISSGGGVDLSGTTLRASGFEATPLSIVADGDITLDGADIDLESRLTGTRATASLTSNNGSINLGEVSLTTSGSSGVDVILDAALDITSAPADGQAATTSSSLSAAGNLELLAGNNISLQDTALTTTAGSGPRATKVLGGGDVDLGQSVIDAVSDVTVGSGATLDLDTLSLVTPGDVILAAATSISSNGTIITTPDLEVHGFNTATGLPDAALAVGGNVALRTVSGANTDISVWAQGDINLSHAGAGDMTLERLGSEGPGAPGSAASLRSENGDISLVSDGTVRIGKGSGDGNSALVQASGSDARVFMNAQSILDQNDGGTSVTDISSGGEIELRAGASLGQRTASGALELQAPDIILDASQPSGAGVNVTARLLSGNDYLEVRGDNSDIQVTDAASGGVLAVTQAGGESRLSLGQLNTGDIYYVDDRGVALTSLLVGAGQSLAVEARGGDIVSGITAGGDGGPANVDLSGSLALVASGNIGERGQSVVVDGGVVAARSGGEILLESNGTSLTVGDVSVSDRDGNVSLSALGLAAPSDVELKMTFEGGSQLSLQSDVASGTGIAVDVVSGDVVQASGRTLAAPDVALRVGGDAGTFSQGGGATEIALDADRVVIDVEGDALVARASGDLEIAEQVSLAGQTYQSRGAGDDLRVRAMDGSLTLSTDLVVGGDAALISGPSLVAGTPSASTAQLAPNSVILDGDLTAGQNLTIVSQGGIERVSGTLTAPNIGLGAGTSIGTSSAPLQLVAGQASFASPSAANAVDADGFTEVNQVSAVGVTVNQQVGSSPVDPTNPPGPNPPGPNPPGPNPPGPTPPGPNPPVVNPPAPGLPGVPDQIDLSPQTLAELERQIASRYPFSQDQIQTPEDDEKEEERKRGGGGGATRAGQQADDQVRRDWWTSENFLRTKRRP